MTTRHLSFTILALIFTIAGCDTGDLPVDETRPRAGAPSVTVPGDPPEREAPEQGDSSRDDDVTSEPIPTGDSDSDASVDDSGAKAPQGGAGYEFELQSDCFEIGGECRHACRGGTAILAEGSCPGTLDICCTTPAYEPEPEPAPQPTASDYTLPEDCLEIGGECRHACRGGTAIIEEGSCPGTLDICCTTPAYE